MVKHYTLYLDESGDPGWVPPRGRSTTANFVLGGLALTPEMDNQAQKRIDELVNRYLGDDEEYELRFSGLHARRGPYRSLTWDKASEMLEEVLDLLNDLKPLIFGTIIVKKRHQQRYKLGAIHPKRLALRGMVQRFDLTLGRRDAFGSVVMDEEHFRKDAELRRMIYLARTYGLSLRGALYDPPRRTAPSRINGVVNFAPSQYTPGIQLADVCSGVIWRRFERNERHLYDRIVHLLDKYPGGSEPSVVPR